MGSPENDDRELTRQEQIWAGLYGPATAAELVAAARAMRVDKPDADIREIVRSVEPEGDDDTDEAGTMRPA